MITIIKECKEKTKSQKREEKTYIKKCSNCKSIFTYQNEDIKTFNSWDDYYSYLTCPVCSESSGIFMKRKYRGTK